MLTTRTLFPGLLFLFGSMSLFCQNTEIDSLKKLVATSAQDTAKVNKLNLLSRLFWKSGEFDSSLHRSGQAGILADKLNYETGRAEAFINKGIASDLQGKYPSALGFFFSGLKIYEKTNDKAGIAKTNSNIAVIYGKQNNFDESEKYTLIAIKLFLELKGMEKQTANCYNNLGSVNLLRKQYEKAIQYFDKASAIFEKINYLYGRGKCVNNIGTIYKFQGKYEEAEKYYKEAYAIQNAIGDKGGLAITLDGLSSVYLRTGQLAKAKPFLAEEMKTAFETGSMDEIKNSYYNQSVYDSLVGNHRDAYFNYRKYIAYKDSIINEENTRSSIQQQIQFDFDKKAVADSLRYENEKALVAIQLEKQKTQRNYLYIIIGLSLISAGFIFNRFRIAKKQKKAIETANKELERLNTLNQKIFSVISHDFKGPITTLKLLLQKNELIASDNPLVNMYIKDVNHQLHQSDEILESLLDWAKAELQIKFSDAKTSDLLSTVEKVIQQQQVKLNSKNLVIQNKISSDVELPLPGEVLTIVLRNLVSNAIKFSYEGQSIEISYSNGSVYVKDAGKGIDTPKLEKLFTKQLAPGIGTSQETGFGLGLYMSNELLAQFKAKLKAENNPGGGSTFSIHFD
ncbi:MAG TPA: tetratricopeptide repeat-containing sensor histidine kinase [Bacteroidia bacterium]